MRKLCFRSQARPALGCLSVKPPAGFEPAGGNLKRYSIKYEASGEIISQVAAACWMPQLAQRLSLDLAYPFARHLEVSSNFF